MNIPKRFFRVWLGPNEIPVLFEGWWAAFKAMHPGYEFQTIGDDAANRLLYPELDGVYRDCKTYAGRADVIRYCVIARLGGVYIDTDVMPLRPFDPSTLSSNPTGRSRVLGRRYLSRTRSSGPRRNTRSRSSLSGASRNGSTSTPRGLRSSNPPDLSCPRSGSEGTRSGTCRPKPSTRTTDSEPRSGPRSSRSSRRGTSPRR